MLPKDPSFEKLFILLKLMFCVAVVKHLPVLHASVVYILQYFDNMICLDVVENRIYLKHR